MIQSMTGYGRGEGESGGIKAVVEIRAVNHRYRDILFRMPRELVSLEEKMKQLISRGVSRGRLEVIISVKDTGERERKVEVNLALARAYYQALQSLREGLALGDGVTLEQVCKYPDILEAEKGEALSYWPPLEAALGEALASLGDMRRREGERLARDVRERLGQVRGLLGEIQEEAPRIPGYYRERLQEKVKEILPPGREIDEERFLAECAYLAERCDIHEEIVRMGSHLEAFQQAFQETGGAGRKMEFLVQEILRETNTIGSKANNYQVSRLVVDIKSQLEKIREQIQNIE